MKNIATFDDLLHAAREVDHMQAQSLLFVFVQAELPQESTPDQHQQYLAGRGGALVPVMSVDRRPFKLDSMQSLVAEAQDFATDWSLVFVTTLSGMGKTPPTMASVNAALNRMVALIKAGQLDCMIPFDRDGNAVVLH
jgi:hypothetical protein